MSRSSKKGPFVQERLMARVEALNAANSKQMLKTWSPTVRPGRLISTRYRDSLTTPTGVRMPG